jgi:hypothetical protein
MIHHSFNDAVSTKQDTENEMTMQDRQDGMCELKTDTFLKVMLSSGSKEIRD